jgi:hypothetical protein
VPVPSCPGVRASDELEDQPEHGQEGIGRRQRLYAAARLPDNEPGTWDGRSGRRGVDDAEALL